MISVDLGEQQKKLYENNNNSRRVSVVISAGLCKWIFLNSYPPPFGCVYSWYSTLEYISNDEKIKFNLRQFLFFFFFFGGGVFFFGGGAIYLIWTRILKSTCMYLLSLRFDFSHILCQSHDSDRFALKVKIYTSVLSRTPAQVGKNKLTDSTCDSIEQIRFLMKQSFYA